MIRLPETETEYLNSLVDAAYVGGIQALEMAGHIKPYLKLREANRLYGPAVVKRWIQEGLVTAIKDGDRNASVRISRVEIAAVARTCNRTTYLPMSERTNNKPQQNEKSDN